MKNTLDWIDKKTSVEDSENKSTTASMEAAFLTRMSHNLRTPMNAIIGLAALTIEDAKNPAAVCENMTKLMQISNYMTGLVNDILDMSAIESGDISIKPEPCFYNDFLMTIKSMFEDQCHQKGILLEFYEPEGRPFVMADKTRMNQIFSNIFSNAVKYTPAYGKITYSAENLQIFSDHMACDYVIRDSGIGMGDCFKQHAFETFAQEDTSVTPELQGSGLGLSIAKRLIEMMGGSIRIESEKGKGTSVAVHMQFESVPEKLQGKTSEDTGNGCTVPKAEGFAGNNAASGHSTDILAGKHVLLVEDHPLNAQIVCRLLEKKGMQVTRAENGRTGVQCFAAAEKGYFAAILMDIRMPEMSGIEAAEAIRRMARPDARLVPIIAMTANAYAEDMKKSREAGMNAHLAKPVIPQKLFETLRRMIKK